MCFYAYTGTHLRHPELHKSLKSADKEFYLELFFSLDCWKNKTVICVNLSTPCFLIYYYYFFFFQIITGKFKHYFVEQANNLTSHGWCDTSQDRNCSFSKCSKVKPGCSVSPRLKRSINRALEPLRGKWRLNAPSAAARWEQATSPGF